MLEAFTQPTFNLLTQPNGFRDHPDTVDDWFRLCARWVVVMMVIVDVVGGNKGEDSSGSNSNRRGGSRKYIVV